MLSQFAKSLGDPLIHHRVTLRLWKPLPVGSLLTIAVNPVFLRPSFKMLPIFCQVGIADQRRQSLRRAHRPLDHGLRIVR